MDYWTTDAPIGTSRIQDHRATLAAFDKAIRELNTGHSVHIKDIEVYVEGVLWRKVAEPWVFGQ